MRGDPQDITTTSARVVEYKGGKNGELVVIYNPSTNTNTVFLALNRAATTAAVTGQIAVAPGQFSIPFLLNMDDNAGGINGIAATGTTVVTVFRAPFLTAEEYNAAVVGFAAGVIAAQYWIAISGTQVALSGAFTEARADTVRAKTTGATLAMQNDQGNNSFQAAPGANGDSAVLADGNGNAVLASGDATDFITVSTSTINFTRNGQQKANLDDSTGLQLLNSTPFVVNAGSGDNRSFLDTVGVCVNTPVAGGVIASAHYSINLPIKSGSTIATNDIVEWDPGNDNRVQSSAAGSTNPQLGICQTGGTGNAGGTVFARVIIRGIVISLVADAAGVTAGQYVAAGATTANRVLSTAALTANSFGRCLKTAGAAAATTIMVGLT